MRQLWLGSCSSPIIRSLLQILCCVIVPWVTVIHCTNTWWLIWQMRHHVFDRLSPYTRNIANWRLEEISAGRNWILEKILFMCASVLRYQLFQVRVISYPLFELDMYVFFICFLLTIISFKAYIKVSYSERQKKLITSSERHWPKSVPSKLIIGRR